MLRTQTVETDGEARYLPVAKPPRMDLKKEWRELIGKGLAFKRHIWHLRAAVPTALCIGSAKWAFVSHGFLAADVVVILLAGGKRWRCKIG